MAVLPGNSGNSNGGGSNVDTLGSPQFLAIPTPGVGFSTVRYEVPAGERWRLMSFSGLYQSNSGNNSPVYASFFIDYNDGMTINRVASFPMNCIQSPEIDDVIKRYVWGVGASPSYNIRELAASPVLRNKESLPLLDLSGGWGFGVEVSIPEPNLNPGWSELVASYLLFV